MSTANRPTFHQALGSHASSNRAVPTALRRVRDLPSEGKLKLRDRELTLAVPNEQPFYPQDADIASSASSSSDDDDDAELQRELERIKTQRAKQQEEKTMSLNPLNNLISRRWDDDTIFKNKSQSSGGSGQKRFINDAVRSDFHRRFLNKYII